MKERGRTLLYAALGVLLGSVLGAVLFPLLFGNRTAVVALVSLLVVCGLVLGSLAMRQARRR